MIALPELHNLIRSLNKPEKRFFKLLSATENFPVDKTIALFDYIEKINETEDIYHKTEKEKRIDTSLENMSALYKLILKSQRNFYSETITGFALNDELANLKILFEKAQYKQCRKMIKTVKEKALKNEKFSYLLEILELEKQLLRTEVLDQEYSEQYALLKKQKEIIVEREKNVGTYYQLYSRLRFQIKSKNLKGKKNEELFTDFLLDPYIKNPGTALSRKAMFLHMKCRALCYNALRNQAKREAQLVELKNFMQEDDLIFGEMPRQYIDVLNSLANTYIEKGDYPSSRKILSEIQVLLNTKKLLGSDLYIKARSYCFNIELSLLLFTGKFSQAEEFAQTIYEFVKENKAIFNKEDKSVLLYNLVNYYICNSNYGTAAMILETAKTESDKNSRWDIKAYSRIQEMIVYYELKEYPRFILAANSAKSLLKDKTFTTSAETHFINFFGDIATAPVTIPSEKKFKTLYQDLKSHNNNEENKWVNFFYFNFLAYAGYKAGEGKMKELMLKHLTVKDKITE